MESAKVLATVDQHPVFFAQGNTWACSFHVELGDDPSLHELFLKL
jgi:glutamine amidotransferase PdxT